jgi:hypothetical protein
MDVRERRQRGGLPPHAVGAQGIQPGRHGHVGGELPATVDWFSNTLVLADLSTCGRFADPFAGRPASSNLARGLGMLFFFLLSAVCRAAVSAYVRWFFSFFFCFIFFVSS